MISLVHAAANIGKRVVYTPMDEHGKIAGVNDRFVWVLYDGDYDLKATAPGHLEWELTVTEVTPTAEPSCASCPSFLTADKAVDKFGTGVGSPQCGRFGIVLGRPEMTAKEVNAIHVTIGARCESYGVPVGEGVAEQYQPTVAKPLEAAKLRREDERTGHCGNCVNFIPSADVVKTFGWVGGMCGAKGKLIPPGRAVEFAKGCDYALRNPKEAEHPVLIDSIELIEWYKYSEEVVASDKIALVEREVTAVDAALGIDKWLKVKDANGEGETWIPHFKMESIDPSFREMIPQSGDAEHPELYRDHGNVIYRIAVSWLELGETPIAWGPAGVGKTEVARHLAHLMGLPFFRFSITASTELDDLAGKVLYTPEKGTYFQYGRLPIAWQQKCIILLDEPNTAPPDVWQFLRPLTDNSQQMVLDIHDGERIQRDKHAFMMLAANPAWDARNIGANTIGDADGSRLMHIRMDLPDEKLETEIIQARVQLDKWTLNDIQRRMIANIATDIRRMVDDQTLPITWGLRNQIKVARSLKWFDPITAYRVATDNLDPASQELILASVRSHVPVARAMPSKTPGAASHESLRDAEARRRTGGIVTPTRPGMTSSAGRTPPPTGIRRTR